MMNAPTVDSGGAVAAAAILAEADSEQRAMMAERIIVVDQHDKVLRPGSKEETHIWESIKHDGILHRAFSVFLIDPEGKLLVQQVRAAKFHPPQVD
jgi:isopentenyl-diphosphate delta-isomerase